MTYFDHFAQSQSTQGGELLKRWTKHQEFRLIVAQLPSRAAAILEIGPGKGELSELFREAGYHNYTAVEPNALMREHLRLKGFQTKNYLLPSLDEADQSYDAIILIDVFEHLNDAREAQQFISEAKRVLRPAGILCITSPDYLHWGRDFFNCDYSHNNVTSVRRTLQLLHNNGLTPLQYKYFSSFFTGTAATILSHLARLGLAATNSNGLDQKLYKLKLTLLRRFMILASV